MKTFSRNKLFNVILIIETILLIGLIGWGLVESCKLPPDAQLVEESIPLIF